MRTLFKFFVFLLLLSALPAYAQSTESSMSIGFFNDLLTEIEYVQGQVLQLAEAMPEEKYSWRPGEGVRSVGEVYVHIGMGNYFSLSYLGGSLPEGFNPELDKQITKKTEIIDFLKKSYDYAKSYILSLNAEDLEYPIEFFGEQSNGRRMLFLILYHNHEHLGQSIAYARSNGIVPPWSQAQK